MVIMNCWNFIESKRARVNKKKKKSDHSYALKFIGVMFGLTFIPLILYFLYNVYKDPLTPTLIKNGSEILKEKTMGFLSKKNKKELEKES